MYFLIDLLALRKAYFILRELVVILVLLQILLLSSCNCADEYNYPPLPEYSSIIVLRDVNDTIRNIKFDVKADTIKPNKTFAPILISYIIPTWMNVTTDKKSYRLSISVGVQYGFINDRDCGQGGPSMEILKPTIDSINGGAIFNKRVKLGSSYDAMVIDSFILLP